MDYKITMDSDAHLILHRTSREQALEFHPTVGETRGTGLWTAIDFTMDRKKRTHFPLNRIINLINRAKKKGLIVKKIGQALEFAPPLTIQKEEIDEAIRILDFCISEEEKEMGL